MRAQQPMDVGEMMDWYYDQPPSPPWPESHKWTVVVFALGLAFGLMCFYALRLEFEPLMEANPELTMEDLAKQLYDEMFGVVAAWLLSIAAFWISLAALVVQFFLRLNRRPRQSAEEGSL